MLEEQQGAEPAHFLAADRCQFEYREKCSPRTANLLWLTCGIYRVAPHGASGELCHRAEESLLFCLAGRPTVQLDGRSYSLNHYDVLYVPLGTPYWIANEGDLESLLVVCRAAATNRHAPYHAVWQKVRAEPKRTRHLDRKDVFLMFDVTEQADRLLAGYTIYQPHTRAWPPHKHTDQEEIYIFTKGHGMQGSGRRRSCTASGHSTPPPSRYSITIRYSARTRSCISSGASPAPGIGSATSTRSSWMHRLTS